MRVDMRVVLDRKDKEKLTHPTVMDTFDISNDIDLITISAGTMPAYGTVTVPRLQLINSLRKLGVI